MVVVAVIVMTIIVVVAMVFVIPMAFVNLPALLVVVVVRMAPIGTGIRWPLPDAWDPDIAAAALSPVAVHPGVALSRDRRPYFIPHRWWRGTDINLDLAKCRNR
jgi:hypothetical protein